MEDIICTFDEFTKHLDKHIADLRENVEFNDKLYSESDFPKLKAVLVDASSQMERNISKLHLFFSDMTLESLISLLKDIETVFIGIVQSARLFMSCGLCNAAKNEVIAEVVSIDIAINNLVDHCKQCCNSEKKQLSPSMTGAVWDACKHLSTISDSNKRASLKEIMRNIHTVRDIYTEIKQHIEEDDDDDWDGLLDDMDIDDEEMGEEAEEGRCEETQKFIVDSVGTIQHLLECLFKIYGTLPDLIPFNQIRLVNSVSDAMTILCTDVNNMGVMIYAEEDTDVEVTKKVGNDVIILCDAVKVALSSNGTNCFVKMSEEIVNSLQKLSLVL